MINKIYIQNIESILNKLQGLMSRAIDVVKKGDLVDSITNIVAKICEQLKNIEDAKKP